MFVRITSLFLVSITIWQSTSAAEQRRGLNATTSAVSAQEATGWALVNVTQADGGIIYNMPRPVGWTPTTTYANHSSTTSPHFGTITGTFDPNAILGIPKGYGRWQDSTFRTYCPKKDTACLSTCLDLASKCAHYWVPWTQSHAFYTRTDSLKVSTTTTTLQNYSYSPVDPEKSYGYIYALPDGPPISTITSTQTYSIPSSVITAWDAPLPSCWPWYGECTRAPDCEICTVTAGTVKVLYWPTDTANVMNVNRTTTSAVYLNATVRFNDDRISSARTEMYGTNTLISPSAYISFETAYAVNDCGRTVGRTVANELLAMDPNSIFSLDNANYVNGWTTTDGQETMIQMYVSSKFNFNDFAGSLPPLDAYSKMPGCLHGGCMTIYADRYRPQLMLPPKMREMDPAWKDCALDWEGAWDPPLALHAAKTVAAVTTDIAPTMTVPPSPQSTVQGPAEVTESPSDPDSTILNPGLSAGQASDLSGFQQSAVPEAQSLPNADPMQASSPDDKPTPTYTLGFSGEQSAASPDPQLTQTVQVAPEPLPTAETPPQTPSGLQAPPSGDPATASSNPIASYIYGPFDLPSSSQAGPANGEQAAASPQPSGEDPAGQAGQLATLIPGSNGAASQAEVSTQVVIASHTVSQLEGGGLAVGSTTLSAGGDPATVGNSIYSALSGGGLVAAGGTTGFPDPTSSFQQPVVAGQTVSVVASGGLAVAGTTISAGGDPLTLSSAVYSANSNGGLVIVSDSPSPSITPSPTNALEVLSAAMSAPSRTHASSVGVITGPDGNLHSIAHVPGGYALDGKTTLETGHAATVSGFGYISAGTNGQVIGGGRPAATSTPTSDEQQATIVGAVFSLDKETYTAYYTGGVISMVLEGEATTVLFGSGSPTTVPSGQTVSLDNAGHLVAAGSTISLTLLASSNSAKIMAQATSSQPPEAVLTLGSSTVTAMQQASNVAEVDGMKLTVGGDVLASAGHIISAVSSGVVVDGLIVDFATPTTSVQVQALLTLASSAAITAEWAGGSGEVEIGDQTLQVGGSAVVSAGHTLSAASNGIVEDGTLVAFKTSTRTLTRNGSSAGGSVTSLPVVLAGPTAEESKPATPTTAAVSSTTTEAVGSNIRPSLLIWLLGSLPLLIIML